MAVFAFFAPGLDSTLQTTVWAFVGVPALLGLGIYAFNFFHPGGGSL